MKQAEMTGAHTWWQIPEGLAFVEAERLKALQLTEPFGQYRDFGVRQIQFG